MAVALPDALPPVQSTVQAISAQASESGSLSYNQYRIHLMGDPLLDEAALAGVDDDAKSLSDVVRNLSSAVYRAGYPASQVYYALEGDDLYVLAVPGKVTAVEGDARIARYFDAVPGQDPLQDGGFERARSLASLHADRAGQNYKPVLTPDKSQPGQSTMSLKPQADKPDPTDIRAEIGNPGNRFVGRHFLKLDLSHAFASGDQFAVTWNEGLSGLNDPDDAEDYHQQKLVWNRVTPWGLFGLSAHNEDYTLDTLNVGSATLVESNGDLQLVEAAWLYPLHATFRSRWTVNVNVDYTDKELSETASGDIHQSQKYGSVELGTAYTHTLSVMDLPLTLSGGLAVRQGMGDDKTGDVDVRADLGYLLFRPQLGAELASADWVTSLRAVVQISDDAVPEQSQWVMGGVGNVSTSLPGVAVGDSGGLARLALRYDGLPTWQDLRLVPTLFAEYGYARYEETPSALTAAGFALPGGTPSMADVGLDLNLKWKRHATLRLTYAEKIDDRDVTQAALDQADANLFFSLVLDL